MPLIVVGESGVANSYITEEDADLYFEDRFNLVWPATPDKGAALIRATAFIDAWYRGKWKGTKTDAGQPLAWPRSDVIDEEGNEYADDAIPQPLKDAVCEAALKSVSVDLFADWTPEGAIASRSVSVGPVSESISYVTPARGSHHPIYSIIDALLKGLLQPGSLGGTAFLLRA